MAGKRCCVARVFNIRCGVRCAYCRHDIERLSTSSRLGKTTEEEIFLKMRVKGRYQEWENAVLLPGYSILWGEVDYQSK